MWNFTVSTFGLGMTLPTQRKEMVLYFLKGWCYLLQKRWCYIFAEEMVQFFAEEMGLFFTFVSADVDGVLIPPPREVLTEFALVPAKTSRDHMTQV